MPIFFCGGSTIPADIINFAASSTSISNTIVSFWGTNSKKPEVGLGVVGTNMLYKSPELAFWRISLQVLVEIKPIAQIPFLGYSNIHTLSKLFSEEVVIVSTICFTPL